MKRLFVVFMCLMFIVFLTGCNESQDKVKNGENVESKEIKEENNCNNGSEEENNDSTKITLNMETEKYIKQCVINYHKSKNPMYLKTIDDIIIKHYYGDFNGIQIAVIKGDVDKNIAVVDKPYYLCLVGDSGCLIKYLPEIISVYYENNYYTLQEACIKGLITREILDQLDCYY